MKHRSFVLLVCGLTCLFSCSKSDLQTGFEYYENYDVRANNDYRIFVNTETLEGLLLKESIPSKGSADYKYSTYIGPKGDTLMYIVNYANNKGWKILSADARTPAVIAESDYGFFSLEEGCESVRLWLGWTSDNLERIRYTKSEDLKFTKEDLHDNLAYWSLIDAIQRDTIATKGNWVVETTSETLIVDSRDHLTPHWTQRGDYNYYCPRKSSSSTERVPAGCVAVAGAEVLYYLHNKFGIPASMVSEGYCTGYLGNYSMDFSNPTTDIWAYMDTTYNSSLSSPYAEALIIGHVGLLADMNYGQSQSWTFPYKLRTQVFNYYGISASHGGYDESVVKENLENMLPVIVTASNLLIPADFDIHCFVIDGYKITQIKRTHHHYWDPNEPDPNVRGIHPPWEGDYYTYSYTDPEITAIKINWGWASQWGNSHLNDGWYTLTDDWCIYDSNNTVIGSYNYNRSMIYGFSLND